MPDDRHSVEFYVTLGGAFDGPDAEELEQKALIILRRAAYQLRELGGREEPASLSADYFSTTHRGTGSLVRAGSHRWEE